MSTLLWVLWMATAVFPAQDHDRAYEHGDEYVIVETHEAVHDCWLALREARLALESEIEAHVRGNPYQCLAEGQNPNDEWRRGARNAGMVPSYITSTSMSTLSVEIGGTGLSEAPAWGDITGNVGAITTWTWPEAGYITTCWGDGCGSLTEETDLGGLAHDLLINTVGTPYSAYQGRWEAVRPGLSQYLGVLPTEDAPEGSCLLYVHATNSFTWGECQEPRPWEEIAREQMGECTPEREAAGWCGVARTTPWDLWLLQPDGRWFLHARGFDSIEACWAAERIFREGVVGGHEMALQCAPFDLAWSYTNRVE